MFALQTLDPFNDCEFGGKPRSSPLLAEPEPGYSKDILHSPL